MLVVNEPNLTSQSNLTPQQAATLWPSFEATAAHTDVKKAIGGRSPQIDYLAFLWYDYGLASQLDRLVGYAGAADGSRKAVLVTAIHRAVGVLALRPNGQ